MEKFDLLTIMVDYFKFARGVDKFENTYWGKDYTKMKTLSLICRIFYYGMTIFIIIKGSKVSAICMFFCAIFLVWINVICFTDTYLHILKKEWKEQNEKH